MNRGLIRIYFGHKKMSKIPKSVGIHDGLFHADEVTACALLEMFDFIDRSKIVRTRDSSKLASCEFVCDVGGEFDPSRKLFDHHQSDYTGPLSSAGMILQYLRDTKVLTSEEYEMLNDELIKDVDDHDNGRIPQPEASCTFSQIIENFYPIDYEATEAEESHAFLQALDFAKGHLERVWQRFHFRLQSRDVVATAMQKADSYLLFDKALPWQENFFSLGGESHPASFIIMPCKQHWKLRGIPPDSEHLLEVRIPLPKEWAGLLGEDLEKVSGIKGAIFCHKGRFISVWKTKEAALKALEYVMQYASK